MTREDLIVFLQGGLDALKGRKTSGKTKERTETPPYQDAAREKPLIYHGRRKQHKGDWATAIPKGKDKYLEEAEFNPKEKPCPDDIVIVHTKSEEWTHQVFLFVDETQYDWIVESNKVPEDFELSLIHI